MNKTLITVILMGLVSSCAKLSHEKMLISREVASEKGRKYEVYNMPIGILKEAYANGAFYPKMTSTPWVLAKKSESLQELREKLFTEVNALFPRATISASRVETVELIDWEQEAKENTTQYNSKNVNGSSKTFILSYENKRISKISEESYSKISKSSSSNYYAIRYVIEFIDISEIEILKTKARMANEFANKIKDQREIFDSWISAGNYDEIEKALVKMHNVAVDAAYSAKQSGLSSLQVEEIISNYRSRLNYLKKLRKDGSGWKQYISDEMMEFLEDVPL